MSDVLFQTEHGSAPVAGAERARAATLVGDLAVGLLAPHRPAVAKRLADLLAPDHNLATVSVEDPRWAELFRAAFTGYVDAGLIQYEGRSVDTFALALNTAVLVGNDCVRFLAWLHAECEAHGYIEPAHQDWCAGIVEEGLATGLLRAGAGWDDVVALLRSEGGPVVLSVAGFGAFPDGGSEQDAPWHDSPREAVGGQGMGWAAAVDRLRGDRRVVSLDPVTIRQPYGHGLTVLDLIAPDWTQRLTGRRIPA
jgi:hypothetical protein